MIRNILFSLAMMLLTVPFKASAQEYKAVIFGVKADGVTLNTSSIQRAIDYISAKGGGTLTFYVGRYLTGSFELKSNVKLRICPGAVLVFSPNAYDVQGKGGGNAMIYADGQKNMSIFGGGTIEGSSTTLNANIDRQVQSGHISDASAFRPSLIYLNDCSNVSIATLYMQNAPASSVRLNGCQDIRMVKLNIFDKDNNQPAIDITDTKEVKLQNSYFDTHEPVRHDASSAQITISTCKTSAGETLK